jgi:Zn-dependent alcohol dehydrogenase
VADGPPTLGEDELAALVAWAVHAHEEIHRYLRQRHTVLQLAVAVAAAALATVAQAPRFGGAIAVVAPYALGAAALQWLNCEIEVHIAGAVIDDIEATVRAARGKWLLLQETAVTRARPNAFGGAASAGLLLAFLAAASYASLRAAFDAGVRWGVADAAGLAAVAAVVAVQTYRTRTARAVTGDAVRALRSDV